MEPLFVRSDSGSSTGLYLTLLAVIGVLTALLITLGMVLLRLKRRQCNEKVQNDVESFSPGGVPPPLAPEVRGPLNPPPQISEPPRPWMNTANDFPPSYRSSVGSEARGERFARVRLSLLRNAKEVQTFAAVQHATVRQAPVPQDSVEQWIMEEADGPDQGRRDDIATAADLVREFQDQDVTLLQQQREDAGREDLEFYLQLQNGTVQENNNSQQGVQENSFAAQGLQEGSYPTQRAQDDGYPSYPTQRAQDDGYPSYPAQPVQADGYPSYPAQPVQADGYPSYPAQTFQGDSYPTQRVQQPYNMI